MAEQQALGSFYYGAREYNLITFGNYNANGQDTWGAVAVGGNFTDSGGMTLENESWCLPSNSNRSSASDPSVLVAGKLTLAAGKETKINYGSFAYNPKSQNSTAEYITTNKRFYPSGSDTDSTAGHLTLNGATTLADWATASSAIQFSSLKNSLTSASAYLASQTTLGGRTVPMATVNLVNSFQTVTASDKVVSYLDLKAGDYAGQQMNFVVPTTGMLVINLHVSSAGNVFAPGNVKVDGKDGSGSSNSSANRVLWNVVYDDTTYSSLVVRTGELYGSFLSPNGTIEANGRIWGQVIADSFIQSSSYELHQALLTVDLALVPEPSTIALGMGALSLGFVYWRRRQQRQHQQS
jgi:choice-of-anchor A domain-containing protein